MAAHERELISQRTKTALAAAQARGVPLGDPRLVAAREQARTTHHARRPAPEVLAVMREWRSQGAAFREIARRLNRLKIRPGRGREWYGTSVKGQLAA